MRSISNDNILNIEKEIKQNNEQLISALDELGKNLEHKVALFQKGAEKLKNPLTVSALAFLTGVLIFSLLNRQEQ